MFSLWKDGKSGSPKILNKLTNASKNISSGLEKDFESNSNEIFVSNLKLLRQFSISSTNPDFKGLGLDTVLYPRANIFNGISKRNHRLLSWLSIHLKIRIPTIAKMAPTTAMIISSIVSPSIGRPKIATMAPTCGYDVGRPLCAVQYDFQISQSRKLAGANNNTPAIKQTAPMMVRIISTS